tara:strand:+ start:976 stop:1149 length:174 start_codon:yes stop_codon:yes gene_type:complete
MDLLLRRNFGRSIDKRMPENLVEQAMQVVLNLRKPSKVLSSQYTNHRPQHLLKIGVL